MRCHKLIVSGICGAGLWVTAVAQTPTSMRWCAAPRPDEPLLRDAQGLRNPEDSVWATNRYVFDIPLVPDAEIAVVRDEAVCRERAKAYADHIRRVADPDWLDRPVLVIRVGDMYLVDDLSSRDGYWTVLLVDNKWRTRLEYGGGS